MPEAEEILACQTGSDPEINKTRYMYIFVYKFVARIEFVQNV
jgi:hypothetical protein